MRSRFEIASKEQNMSMPTYYDLKYANISKIFEAEEVINSTPEQLQAAENAYNKIIESLKVGNEIDEGLLGAIAGGALGALAGPAVGRAICHVLGIDENGNLGRLLTSRLVTTALGYVIGKGK